MKKINIKKILIIFIPVVLLIIFGIYILIININARRLEIYSEVTFINPTQAIIFWKTEDETLGYIKYGESKWRMKERELQTSSEPGVVHVVFLENIPIEGIYISKHSDKDSFLIFPKIENIKFDEGSQIDG
mgnify:CR=1 FL=1|jgi:hypothetical protein